MSLKGFKVLLTIFNRELRLIIETLTALTSVFAVIGALYGIYTAKKVSARIPRLDEIVEIRQGEDGKTEVFVEPKIQALVDAVGSRLFQAGKMSFLQGLGADAKVQKGLEGALAKDFVEEKLPILDLAGDFLGFNTKQYIAKHPRAIMQLASWAAPFMQNMGKNSFKNQGAFMR